MRDAPVRVVIEDYDGAEDPFGLNSGPKSFLDLIRAEGIRRSREDWAKYLAEEAAAKQARVERLSRSFFGRLVLWVRP